MGYSIIDDKKHIEENDDNKNDKNKVKINTYEKIKDIVLGKNEKIVIEKNNIKKNDIKKTCCRYWVMKIIYYKKNL